MNKRSIPEHNGDAIMAASSYSSKERDLADLVKSTPPPRLAMLGNTSPMNNPAKVTGKNGDDQKKRRKKRKKKWTKPEGKPKRPLSAYNIFFAKERILMLGKDVPTAEQEALKKKVHCKTHGKISFAVMARTIGAKWRGLGSNDKKFFEDRARGEKARYLAELAIWKEAQKNGVSTDGLHNGKIVDDGISVAASQKRQIELGLGSSHAQGEKARYLAELALWKEAQTNGISTGGFHIGKMVDDGISVTASQKRQIELGMGVSNAKSGIVAMSAQATAISDLRAEPSAVESVTPLSQENNGHNSNLVRLILEEENRSRYLSLLRFQNQANQNRYPQIDQATFPLNGAPRRVPTPIDSISGSQPLQRFNVDTMFADRTLLRNIQGPQNPSLQEYNSRYFQVLEEYATILQLEDQHNRMIGAFNGRNIGS